MKRQSVGYRAVPMALVLLAGLGGCKGSERNVAQDSTAATTPDTGAAGANTGAPAAPKGGMTDSNIVALLDEANKVDSANSAIALKKATRPDVKAFAKLMMSDHHALRAAGQQLAKQLGVEPKLPEHDPLAPYAVGETKALQKTPKGPEFDRTYIDNEVSVHQAVLDFANQARVTTQTAQLRDLIEKAVPVIRKHLDQAQAIQKEISPAT